MVEDSKDDLEANHRKRMQERKALVDSGIRAAQESRGVLIVLCGHGKGKSSSAFGTAARSLGHGLQVGIVQFIKGRWTTGEQRFFKDHPRLAFHATGEGFTWETQDRDRDIQAAQNGWSTAAEMLTNDRYNLVVLDELTYVLQYGYVEPETVLATIKARPRRQNVIVTGRDAVAELIELADTVSEIKNHKHAFEAGVKAQKGIEW